MRTCGEVMFFNKAQYLIEDSIRIWCYEKKKTNIQETELLKDSKRRESETSMNRVYVESGRNSKETRRKGKRWELRIQCDHKCQVLTLAFSQNEIWTMRLASEGWWNLTVRMRGCFQLLFGISPSQRNRSTTRLLGSPRRHHTQGVSVWSGENS